MEKSDNKSTSCKEGLLRFFSNKNSAKCLDIIIDIYDEIRYSQIDENRIKQKLLRVLFNLNKSNSLSSLLEEGDRETLNLLIEVFLGIRCIDNKFYIENKNFNNLTLDEIYNVFIETKYLKEKELSDNNKKLSI